MYGNRSYLIRLHPGRGVFTMRIASCRSIALFVSLRDFPSVVRKRGLFHFIANSRRLDVFVQVLDQIMVREDFVMLPAFFVEAHFPLHAHLVKVLDLHVDDGAHPCERVDHHSD